MTRDTPPSYVEVCPDGRHNWRSARRYLDWFFALHEDARADEVDRVLQSCYQFYSVDDPLFVLMATAGAMVTAVRSKEPDESPAVVDAYSRYARVLNLLESDGVCLFHWSADA